MLTPQHTGHWYDPNSSGQGFELHVTAEGLVLATAFLGRIPGYSNRNTWVSFQSQVHVSGPITGYVPHDCVFGENHPLDLRAIGEVTVTPGDDVISAVVLIDLRGIDQPSPVAPPIAQEFLLRRLI